MASWVIPPREPVLHEWNEVGQLVNGHVQRLLWECRVNRNGWGGRMCFSWRKFTSNINLAQGRTGLDPVQVLRSMAQLLSQMWLTAIFVLLSRKNESNRDTFTARHHQLQVSANLTPDDQISRRFLCHPPFHHQLPFCLCVCPSPPPSSYNSGTHYLKEISWV